MLSVCQYFILPSCAEEMFLLETQFLQRYLCLSGFRVSIHENIQAIILF